MTYDIASMTSNTIASIKLMRQIVEKILEKTKRKEIQWVLGRDGTIESRKFHSIQFKLVLVDVEIPTPTAVEIPSTTRSHQSRGVEKSFIPTGRTTFQRIVYFAAFNEDETIVAVNSLLHPELRDVLLDLFNEASKQIGENIFQKLEYLDKLLSQE